MNNNYSLGDVFLFLRDRYILNEINLSELKKYVLLDKKHIRDINFYVNCGNIVHDAKSNLPQEDDIGFEFVEASHLSSINTTMIKKIFGCAEANKRTNGIVLRTNNEFFVANKKYSAVVDHQKEFQKCFWDILKSSKDSCIRNLSFNINNGVLNITPRGMSASVGINKCNYILVYNPKFDEINFLHSAKSNQSSNLLENVLFSTRILRSDVVSNDAEKQLDILFCKLDEYVETKKEVVVSSPRTNKASNSKEEVFTISDAENKVLIKSKGRK